MEKSTELSQRQEQLLEINTALVTSIKNNENKIVNVSSKDKEVLGEKINSLKVEGEDRDLELLTFFVKQLFLDEQGNFDFDFEMLDKFMGEESIITLFNSLKKCVEEKNFLDFILKLGELFSEMYFKPNIDDLITELEHKGLNNYQCLLIIFSKCKKREEVQYFLGNYDIYFSETYLIEIKLNIIFALNAYFRICAFGEKVEDLPSLTNDEENTIDNSDNKVDKINEYEKIIMNGLKVFWSNSNFLFNTKIYSFMTLFYVFITQKSQSNFLLNNEFDDSTKMFLEYMSYNIKSLFKDFNEDSIKKFCLYLFDFLDNHKNQNIEFVDRALRVGTKNNLKNEDIGLISLICLNTKLINELKEQAESSQNYSEEYFSKIISKKGLQDYEILVMGDVFEEVTSKKNSSNQISNENINIDINFEKDNEDKNDGKSNSTKKIQDNIQSKIEKEIEDLSDDPKYKALLNEMNKRFEDDHKQIKELKEEITSQRQKYDDDIKKLNLKISELEDTHKAIYFRDVSKFYIDRFSDKNNIQGNNTYEKCQNIMHFNFSKNGIKSLKEIIIKIVTHYLNGNKLAHMEYFREKYKSLNKKDLIRQIQDSYAEFMKFKIEEKNLLNNHYKFLPEPFFNYNQLKLSFIFLCLFPISIIINLIEILFINFVNEFNFNYY